MCGAPAPHKKDVACNVSMNSDLQTIVSIAPFSGKGGFITGDYGLERSAFSTQKKLVTSKDPVDFIVTNNQYPLADISCGTGCYKQGGVVYKYLMKRKFMNFLYAPQNSPQITNIHHIRTSFQNH